jgi:hypothetical protein
MSQWATPWRPLETRLRVELARRDVSEFCEFAFRGPDNRPWVQQPFHREWQQLLAPEGPARVLIGAPRESAKSSQMAVARVLWELGRNPELRVKIVSATEELAGSLVAEIQRHIERNARLQRVFPGLRPSASGPWTRGELLVQRRSLAKDASVVGHGMLSSGVGGRADLVVFDDVCDYRNAVQQAGLREQIKQAFYEIWLNLLGPTGRAVYVATVWHERDLTMELKAHAEWMKWWRPARDEVTGEPLWPDRWDAEALARREREIGARAFARQFLLRPVSDEELTFPPEVMQACEEDSFVPGRMEVASSWPRYAGVDLAASLGQKASWTVMLTAAVDPKTQRRYPLEIVRKRQNFPATIEMILEQWRRHRPDLVYVESNAFQQAVLDQLSDRDRSIPVKGFRTGEQKYDETVGIPSLAASMANGSWVLPTGGQPHPVRCECGWCAWRRELELHPHGETSDVLMAMWFCELAARRQALFRPSPSTMPLRVQAPVWKPSTYT